MRLSDYLTPEEIHLYQRHIDDGMEFSELAAEFGVSADVLFIQFRWIEDKLRKGFKNG